MQITEKALREWILFFHCMIYENAIHVLFPTSISRSSCKKLDTSHCREWTLYMEPIVISTISIVLGVKSISKFTAIFHETKQRYLETSSVCIIGKRTL